MIVSDGGEQFEPWKASLHSMTHLKRGQKVLRAIRGCMIQLEGWTESPLLPEGWIFKVLKVGVSGEARAFRSTSNIGGKLWSSDMVHLTKEGTSLFSMAAVKEYI